MHLFQSHVDPEYSRNGALDINAANVGGGGSSIYPNVATFEDNCATTVIFLKKPVTAFLGLDVTNGLVVDQLQATQVTTDSLTSSGASVVGNCSVTGALIVGSLACTGALSASTL